MSLSVTIAIPVLMIGGTEMQTLSLVRVLLSAGYQVTVCCYYDYDPAMVSEIETTGAHVVLMGLRRSDGIWHLHKNLKSVFKKLKTEIVHVQYIAPGLIPIITAKLANVPTIFATVHQPGRTYGLKEKILLRLAACLCTAFFCVSMSAEESWFGNSNEWDPRNAGKARKHYTIYNTVDVSRIVQTVNSVDCSRLRRSLGLDNGPVVGVVGRLRKEKGHSVLLKAMVDVFRAYPNANLLVVGDGPDRDKLEKQAQNMGIAKQVRWLGRKRAGEVFRLYAIMDVLAIPSLFEGFGLSAAEAMAAGIPVVASNIDGLREVIEEGVSGYLVPLGDSHGLTSAILKLLENPRQATAMGARGRDRVRARFSLARFADATITAYRYFNDR